jgi:hypothetical protein
MTTSINVILVINEAHNLFPQQAELLEKRYPQGYKTLLVPEKGWDLAKIKEAVEDLSAADEVVITSPIPAMFTLLHRKAMEGSCKSRVRGFHNDRRQKKELPNGRVIQVVAKEGWQLV